VRDDMPYQLLADVVLTLHFCIVAFVVGGLVLTIIGNLSAWRWVNALWFRLAHLVAVAVVVVQAWFGAACALTSLELWLRANAHAATYTGSFIAHWLHRLLYYEAPTWAFTLSYSLFGLLVAAAWWCFPPTTSRRGSEKDARLWVERPGRKRRATIALRNDRPLTKTLDGKMTGNQIELLEASSGEDYAAGKALIEEYAEALGVDLCFQNFPEELANLSRMYAPPRGCLLLARTNAAFVGCVAVRDQGASVCEMKRLYVKPPFRKTGLGRRLAESAVKHAQQLGYSRMVLDTLSTMSEAQALYKSLGFREIERYYQNPLRGVRYLALELATR
jgi:ribosomal protein S18 acetylase RimI-like enzyme